MLSTEERFRKISQRTTAGARQLLEIYSKHKLFPELLEGLGAMRGRIFQEDVANTLAAIMAQKN
jgi:hypothetical protein